MAAGTATVLHWTLPTVVLAMLVAGASSTASFFWPIDPNECPAAPSGKITTRSDTCTYADGSPCPECWGKCCLRDGHCLSAECNKREEPGLQWDCDADPTNRHWFLRHHLSNCIGNINFKCDPKQYLTLYQKGYQHAHHLWGKISSKYCPLPLANGVGTCEPIDPNCPSRSKFCLGKIHCIKPGLCGRWNNATCVLDRVLINQFHVCACDGVNAPANQPPPTGVNPDDDGTNVALQPSPPRPRRPRRPRTPDQPRQPREPRLPTAPRRPRRPRSPPPAPTNLPDRGLPVPAPPIAAAPSTCPPVNIPVTNRCRNGDGGYCSRCLGKCCMDDGFCPSSKCLNIHTDAHYCPRTDSHYWLYTQSNCLGNLGYSCPGSLQTSFCPAALKFYNATCAPLHSDCGKPTINGIRKFTLWGKDSSCLGTISCPNKAACGDWQGAPCIYSGFPALAKLGQFSFTPDFEVCSCPLTK